MTNEIDKLKYEGLVSDANALTKRLYKEYETKKGIGKNTDRIIRAYINSIHRRLRRTAEFNKLFGGNLYLPNWYVVKHELYNDTDIDIPRAETPRSM